MRSYLCDSFGIIERESVARQRGIIEENRRVGVVVVCVCVSVCMCLGTSSATAKRREG